jgi:DNA-binding MarR family transcriptional regulator/N-acetylglutamate synthase-like GNAT family acetyltransferase
MPHLSRNPEPETRNPEPQTRNPEPKSRNPELSRVEAVRRFNRSYTKRIGVLQEGLLESDFSLTEVRVLYELAHLSDPTATLVAAELGLDPGYLSRILRRFEKKQLIEREPSLADGRQRVLRLTKRGRDQFGTLDLRADDEIREMLRSLSEGKQQRLVQSMGVIEEVLEPASKQDRSFVLRTHQPGDMGWIVHRHGVLYSSEYGWDERFEALVARVTADFIERFDPKRERCWVAEKAGEIAGCVFLVKKTERVAQLRLLLVEPTARGLGLGTRLVDECIRFARQSGYRKIFLWTNKVLTPARHIYKRAGFHVTHEERHRLFGDVQIGQTWELELGKPATEAANKVSG